MPTIPIVLLLIGALITWLARRSHERALWGIAVGTAAVAWAAMLALGSAVPTAASLSVWRPVDLFNSRLELVLDSIGWTMGYSTVTLLLAVTMTGAARPGEADPHSRVMMIVYTALGLTAMSSGNLLTVATTWALMDAATLAFLIRTASGAESRQALVTRTALDSTAIVLVVAAAAEDWSGGGQATLAGGLASPAAVGLVSLATLLHLGLMPPHFALPSPRVRHGLGTLLQLLPPAAALCVLGRALGSAVPLELVPWFRAAGVAGLALGAVRWALARDPIVGRWFLVLGLTGVGALAATLQVQSAEDVLGVTGALLLLSGGVVSMAEIHTPMHRLWLAAGGLLLAGMPGSIGGRLAAVFGSGFTDAATWWVAIAGVLGMALMIASAGRAVTAASSPWPTSESLVQLMYGAGLLLPTLAGLGLGLWTRHSFTGAGLGVSVMAIGLSALGMWLGVRVPGRHLARLQRILTLADPTPVYRLLRTGYRRLTRWFEGLTGALEGEGAMLWTYVVVLLVVLSLQ